jgi:hypothetical protein
MFVESARLIGVSNCARLLPVGVASSVGADSSDSMAAVVACDKPQSIGPRSSGGVCVRTT